MCDTEVFVDPNCSRNEGMSIEDQRSASIWYLAFWSNPAWFCKAKYLSLSAAAIKEWVAYHRLSVALSKDTVVQTIENVKQVMPNSKLAKYGDYSYDIEYEDMCCMFEDVSVNSRILKAYKHPSAKRYDFWESESETYIFDQRSRSNNPYSACNRSNLLDCNRSVRSLSEWLETLYIILISVKQIANKAKLLDSWTETLLKFCLRFVCILRNDQQLVKILNHKIPFIIDYEELRKTPITKIELLSIPQPVDKESFCLDKKSVENLWQKLSSPQIQNIWKKFYFNFYSDSMNTKDLFPMIQINFLRSCQTEKIDSPRQAINIPKNIESELLGSLLNVINDYSLQSDKTLTKMGDASLNYFPEAHGDWTNQLFSHNFNLNSPFERNPIIRKPCNASLISQVSDSAAKVENGSTENATMPMQFYKSVPPPTLAARIRPPCTQYQSRNKIIYVPPNNLISSPSNLQVQYKFPTTPILNAPLPKYVTQASPFSNIPQRQPALMYANIAQHYHKMNFLQTPYQYNKLPNLTELQKSQSKADQNACSENTSIENESENLSEEKQAHDTAKTEKFINIPKTITTPFVQLNRSYNIPFRIQKNLGNTTGNTSSISQSAILNSQLKGLEPKMLPKINYPIISHRLRTPLIKSTQSKNHYVFPQCTFKPRFLGPISINNIKKIQERLFLQRHQYEYINSSLSQDVQKNVLRRKDIGIGYENKVEKWLASINKYVKSGSFIDLEKIAELEISELPKSDIKSDDGDEGDCAEVENFQNENIFEVLHEETSCNETKASLNGPNKVNEQIIQKKTKIQRRKKLKAKKVFFEQLHLFRGMAEDLKKCKNMRRKIKVAKKYLSDINSTSIGIFYFGILKMKCGFTKKIKERKKTELLESKKKQFFETKSDHQFSTGDNVNMKQSSLLINDGFKHKIFNRGNQEFNAFPSKRMKLNNLGPSFFKPESLIRDQQDQWISSLNYFDLTIDKLLFTVDVIEGMQSEEANGWTHFKVAIKTIMDNITSSLNARISQNL